MRFQLVAETLPFADITPVKASDSGHYPHCEANPLVVSSYLQAADAYRASLRSLINDLVHQNDGAGLHLRATIDAIKDIENA